MYKPGGTLKEAIKRIEQSEYVLPAIQREFVWKPEQICSLFDSLMQGYPFGTFLFWKVEAQNSGKYKFYGFVRDYHQRNNPHCPDLGLMPNQALTAVLDGQQRLTALNIGLRGSMALKEPNKWQNNPNAYPMRHLYLNLLADNVEGEGGEAYEFRFLEPHRATQDEHHLWFKVSDIIAMPDGPAMLNWLTARGFPMESVNRAYRVLDRLYRVIHTEPVVSYYEEGSQDLERVLNIFIRMNSGGTVLSYSDLLLSIAVAQWRNLDARREIHALVDEINQIGAGFDFSKDFVLKAGLMLTDIASVGFKVENFNHENMAILEKEWPAVRQALTMTVQLVASFGFNSSNLRADSALLPIAYYLFKKKPPANYLTHTQHEADRQAIRGWLVRSLLKSSGIWGSGLDTLLTALRATINEVGFGAFPVEAVRLAMVHRGKSLTFEPEEIEELASLEYGDKRVFPLLSLLFPFVDLRNQFHVDHVFPISRFTRTRLLQAGVVEEAVTEYKTLANQLPNFQLLEGAFNNEKRAVLPTQWLQGRYQAQAERNHYCTMHLLGEIPENIEEFVAFHTARRDRLKERIRQIINPHQEIA